MCCRLETRDYPKSEAALRTSRWRKLAGKRSSSNTVGYMLSSVQQSGLGSLWALESPPTLFTNNDSLPVHSKDLASQQPPKGVSMINTNTFFPCS